MNMKAVSYRWQGITATGQRVSGEMICTHPHAVLQSLETQSITALSIKKKLFNFTKKITSHTLHHFTQQLATLIDANVPLTHALTIIKKGHTHPLWPLLISDIQHHIEAGHPLSEALRLFPSIFNEFYCNLVALGEQTGKLPTLLHQLAFEQEKTILLKRKMLKALFYPATVIAIAIIIVAILLMGVVPQFEKTFSDLGAPLPAYTQLIFWLGKQSHYVFFSLCLMIFGCSGLTYARKKSRALKERIDKAQLHFFYLGKIIRTLLYARFCHLLALSLEAGMPLLEALQALAKINSNVCYQSALSVIQHALCEGKPLAITLQQSQFFEAQLIQMVAVGEESGRLPLMLQSMARYYEQQVEVTIDNLIKLLEPAVMICLGLFIGSLIIAMYLPIFQIGNVI